MGMESLIQVVDDARGRGWTIEGSVSDEQIAFLADLTRSSSARTIAEIGFNAGFSSFAFLSANPDAQVTSFDLVEHEYVTMAKEFMDREFPDRHTLVPGDSRETVPRFAEQGQTAPFDLIFIDGGHTYEVATADIRNMRACADENTIIVFDDLLPHKPWGPDPVRAWGEAVADGVIVQTGLYADGVEVDEVGPEAR
ncbi:class I SAM-dependent methyltransferase, partial [Williamsia sp.]|uniref:O-methyltransferase n=1 Tax=Williamsia sp. TaxID=1872085 RepID=UPI001A18E19E